MPYPDDSSVLHGSGPDPDRILLIGGTLVRGIGVRSHELGMAGHLARKLASQTGHGADVEAHGIPMLSVARAIDEMRAQQLHRFDAVVLMLGNAELLTGRPMRLWRRDLRTVLTAIEELASDGPPVLIASSPAFSSGFDVSPRLRLRIARSITRMNDETRRVCAESGLVGFIDFEAAGPAPTVGSSAAEAYELWAAAMVTPVAQAMASAPPGLHRHVVPTDEDERQRALDKLGLVGAEPDRSVHHIVEMARDMLGVAAASLTIIDHDRAWRISASGVSDEDMPRSVALSNTAIQTPGALIVEDTEASPLFSDVQWVDGDGHFRAYAGYPVEAPGGERIGALCVMDRSPRHFTPDDVAALRNLALRAQHEIWLSAAAAARAG